MCVSSIRLHKAVKLYNGSYQYGLDVPCGKCPECKRAKIHSWLFRLDKELERSSFPWFVTLTYKDKFLTYGENSPTLVKRDLQLYFKRLRKEYEKVCKEQGKKDVPRLKYYACGEYGTKKGRPHYHIILYNCHLPDIVVAAWRQNGESIGHVKCLPLRAGGTTYVMKYMSKERRHLYGVEQEFSLMSKNLGDNYLTDENVNFHLNRVENSWVRTKQGYKIPLPKYYKERMFDAEQRFKVAEYLKERSERSVIDKINRLKRRYPDRSMDFYVKLLEQSKELIKFDARMQEVF